MLVNLGSMMATFDKQGRQIPDPRPVEVPVEMKRPLSLQEEIRRFVRSELSQAADAAGVESFEEADDFEVDEGDEFEIESPYEVKELVPELGDRDASDLSAPEPPPPPDPPVDKGTGVPERAVDNSSGVKPVGDGSPGFKLKP